MSRPEPAPRQRGRVVIVAMLTEVLALLMTMQISPASPTVSPTLFFHDDCADSCEHRSESPSGLALGPLERRGLRPWPKHFKVELRVAVPSASR